MATKNAIYYTEWRRKEYVIRLEFIPGDTTQLNSNFQYIALPNYFLLNCTVKNNYEDGIPIGLPQADVMELEINLSTIEDSDLKSWLIQSESTNTINISGKNLKIPNFWKLLIRKLTETQWKCIFAGFQDRKPERKYKISRKNSDVILEITITGVHRVLLERISVDELKSQNIVKSRFSLADTSQWNQDFSTIYEYYYKGDDKIVSVVNGFNPEKLPQKKGLRYPHYIADFVPLLDIFTKLRQKLDTLFYYFSRSAGTINLFESSFLSHITFFTNDTTSQTQNIGTQIDSNQIYIIQTLYLSENNEIIGGLLEKRKDCWPDQYANCWDWLKDLSENLGVKIQFNYLHQFPENPDSIRLYIKPILEIVNQKITIPETIRNSLEISYGKNYITNTIFHIQNPQELDFNQGNTLWIYAIINWLSGNWANWTKSDKSFEFKVLLSNHTQGLSEDDSCYISIYCKPKISQNQLWTIQNINLPNGTTQKAFIKVNDICTVSMGDGMQVSSANADLEPIPDDTSKLVEFELQLWKWMQTRGLTLSLPFLVAYGYEKALFYYPNASELEIEVDYDAVPNYNLGEMVAIDFSKYTSENLNLSSPADFSNGANSIVVGIESDLSKFQSKVKLFVRGK